MHPQLFAAKRVMELGAGTPFSLSVVLLLFVCSLDGIIVLHVGPGLVSILLQRVGAEHVLTSDAHPNVV